jgi:hypothetical protein
MYEYMNVPWTIIFHFKGIFKSHNYKLTCDQFRLFRVKFRINLVFCVNLVFSRKFLRKFSFLRKFIFFRVNFGRNGFIKSTPGTRTCHWTRPESTPANPNPSSGDQVPILQKVTSIWWLHILVITNICNLLILHICNFLSTLYGRTRFFTLILSQFIE